MNTVLPNDEFELIGYLDRKVSVIDLIYAVRLLIVSEQLVENMQCFALKQI